MIFRGSVFSHVLSMETGLTVIMSDGPFDEQPYQIAYLLHGLCGAHSNIADYTMLPSYASRYHCIFVMPEVGRSLYQDMVFGQPYFRYIAEELPEICRDKFRISAAREDHFIMGISMGGYGALRCALAYPAHYGACVALSSGYLFLADFLPKMAKHANEDDFIAQWGTQFIGDFRAAFGNDFAAAPNCDLLTLAKKANPADLPRFYSACGTNDFLLQDNRRYAKEMTAMGISFQYDEWEGAHDWPFFDEALKKGIETCCKQQENPSF